MREAAAAELIDLLVDSDIDDSQLQQMALSGESPELRWAAGMALGLRWAREAEEGNLRLSDIPRKSSATPYSVEQALIIFAAKNTAVHPGLARASVYPLAMLFTDWESLPNNTFPK